MNYNRNLSLVKSLISFEHQEDYFILKLNIYVSNSKRGTKFNCPNRQIFQNHKRKIGKKKKNQLYEESNYL